MRILLLALMLLLAGCVHEGPSANESASLPPPPNQEPGQGDAGAAPEISGNLSAPSQNESGFPAQPEENLTNASTNGTSPAAPNAGAPQNQSGQNESGAAGGLQFAGGNYSIVLDDASIIPVSSEPCGIFSIRDREGAILEKLLICPGESEYWQGPGGQTYRIFVVKVAAGYSGGKWAQIIVYG